MSFQPLLCLDTSTPVGSLALVGGDGPLAVHTQNSPAAHTERLFTLAERLLADCGLSFSGLGGIAVAAGPGSFTGLRIAVSTAKTLAWSASLPLYAVNTLETLAYGGAHRDQPVCAVLDAGQGELYAACYRWSGPRVKAEELLAPAALSLADLTVFLAGAAGESPVICLGPGFRIIRGALRESLGSLLDELPTRFDLPDAALLGELVLADPEARRVMDIFSFEPLYIRMGQAQLRLRK